MTLKVITDDTYRVTSWASKHLDDLEWYDAFAFGYEFDGEIVGAVIFTEPSKNDIHVSVVCTNPVWWHRRHIKVLFNYAFETCGCTRISALVKASNTKSRKLLKGLGFQQEGVIRQYHKPEDGIVYGILQSECKWI